MSSNEYMSYQAMLTQVNTNLATLRRACDRLELKEHSQALADQQHRLENHTFRVGIMGEFKRGKSTVINALLGQEIVPADILPCSATLNRIVWDAKPHATIHFKKGESGNTPASKDVSVEDLADYVTKLTSESQKRASQVEDAVVYYPCSFCRNGVEIVDTPGLNDDERMNFVSESVIPTLDAIIMVLVPGAPFSMSEAAFVRGKIMTSDLGRLIFVVNKIDTVRPKDRKRVVEGIRNKIQETVLEKTAAVYGEHSKEYEETKIKLGGIRVYPISAADALDAKIDNDQEAFEKSGMADFEEALAKLLTEERGLLELVGPVASLLSKAQEVGDTIEMRFNALNMEKEEFEAIQKKAVQRIEASRAEKKQRVKIIRGVAASTYQDILPMVMEAYNDLETTLTAFVEQYPISAQNFSDKAAQNTFQTTLSAKINEQMQECLQLHTEKMQVQISKRMENEIKDVEIFSRELSAQLNEIRCMIPSHAASGKLSPLDYAAAGLEVVTNFTNIIPGLGAAITGFRDHGILGGVVGLGTGYLMTQGACSVAIALLGLSAVTAVPILVISGIAGAFGGRAITNGLFALFGGAKHPKPAKISDSDLATIRSNVVKSVKDSIDKMRLDHTLENWLRDTTDQTFQTLSARVEEETEQALQGMQDTLTQIQIDLANDAAHRESVVKQLKETQEELIAVLTSVKPIKDKLDNALNNEAAAV